MVKTINLNIDKLIGEVIIISTPEGIQELQEKLKKAIAETVEDASKVLNQGSSE